MGSYNRPLQSSADTHSLPMNHTARRKAIGKNGPVLPEKSYWRRHTGTGQAVIQLHGMAWPSRRNRKMSQKQESCIALKIQKYSQLKCKQAEYCRASQSKCNDSPHSPNQWALRTPAAAKHRPMLYEITWQIGLSVEWASLLKFLFKMLLEEDLFHGTFSGLTIFGASSLFYS